MLEEIKSEAEKKKLQQQLLQVFSLFKSVNLTRGNCLQVTILGVATTG